MTKDLAVSFRILVVSVIVLTQTIAVEKANSGDSSCAKLIGMNEPGPIGESGIHASVSKLTVFVSTVADGRIPLSDHQVVELRGQFDGADLPDLFQSPIIGGNGLPLDLAWAVETRQTSTGLRNASLAFLYKLYEQQGQGRSENINIYKNEDRTESTRIAHYIWSMAGEPIAHVQAQYSRSSSAPLNLEQHFPEVRSFIRGNDGNNVAAVEIGRLFVTRARDISNWENTVSPGLQSGRSQFIDLVWLNMLVDLKRQDDKTIFVFQVNPAVFKVLTGLFAPVSLDNFMRVGSSASGSKEYIVKLTHSNITDLTVLFARRWFSSVIRGFVEASSSPEDQMNMAVPAKFEPVLRDLGVYRHIASQKLLETESILEGLGFLPLNARAIANKHILSPSYQEIEGWRAAKAHFIVVKISTAKKILAEIAP